MLVIVVTPAAMVSAKTSPACRARAARPALGIGVNASASGGRVSESQPVPYVSTEMGSGVGFSLDGAIPFAGPWSVRVFAGVTRFGAARHTFSRERYEEVSSQAAGAASVRRLQLGMVKTVGDGRLFCGYAGLTGGTFRVSYKGVTSRPVSGAGLVGFDWALGNDAENSLAMEFQLEVAPNHSRPPLDNYAIVGLGATLVFRHRF
jgi:hypothetical protein